MRQRLGVFGGTFDPLHVGHVVAAVGARHQLGLDRVLLVVANEPWQKGDRDVSPAPDRLAMVEAATEDLVGLEPSTIEIERGGTSYTVDTLGELRRRNADVELFLIVGADVAADLGTWERADELPGLATLAVVTRAGSPRPELAPGWRVEWVEIPALAISSTDLRARARDGRPLDGLVPASVVHCIRERRLYASSG